MEAQEKQFTEGFNHGYLIAKHEPELYSTVTKGLDNKNDYIDGLISGGKEYEMEKHAPEKHHSKETKDKDRDIEKDR
jgi:hypothetical protein